MTKLYKIIIVTLVLLGIVFIYIIKQNNNNIDSLQLDVTSYNMFVDNSFNLNETLSLGYPTMIEVGNEYCLACKEMMPIMVDVAKMLDGKAFVLFVDYAKYPKIAKNFEFELTPTQFFYNKEGKLHKKHVGLLSKDNIITIFLEMGVELE